MNKLFRIVVLTALGLFSLNSTAIPISGTVDYAGQWAPTDSSGNTINDILSAVGVSFVGGTVSAFPPATGDLAAMNPGDVLTLAGFKFSPTLNPNPVDIWVDTTSGKGYKFTLQSVSVTSQTAGFLGLAGGGILSCSACAESATGARWTFSGQIAGEDDDGNNIFGFSATTIPEPGSLALLGLGLIGLGFLRKGTQRKS